MFVTALLDTMIVVSQIHKMQANAVSAVDACLLQSDSTIVDMLRDPHPYMLLPPRWSVKLRLTST